MRAACCCYQQQSARSISFRIFRSASSAACLFSPRKYLCFLFPTAFACVIIEILRVRAQSRSSLFLLTPSSSSTEIVFWHAIRDSIDSFLSPLVIAACLPSSLPACFFFPFLPFSFFFTKYIFSLLLLPLFSICYSFPPFSLFFCYRQVVSSSH